MLKSSFQGQRQSNRKIFFAIFMALFFLVLIWSFVGPYGLRKYFRMKTYYDDLYLANIEQSKKNKDVEERIRLLKGDHKVQEETVRRELGWIRDNEVVYIFLDDRK